MEEQHGEQNIEELTAQQQRLAIIAKTLQTIGDDLDKNIRTRKHFNYGSWTTLITAVFVITTNCFSSNESTISEYL